MIKPTRHYLIEPLGSEYINEKDGIIINTGIENAKYVNRYGKLISKPYHDDSELSVGDICIVHHNCFRTYYDMKGRQKTSAEHFRDNLYLIPKEKIYLYKTKDVWKTFKEYCFVSPISYNQDNVLYRPDKVEEEHVGIVEYANSAYFKKGDKVGFVKNREYEFDVDGQKMYRMRNKDICVIL